MKKEIKTKEYKIYSDDVDTGMTINEVSETEAKKSAENYRGTFPKWIGSHGTITVEEIEKPFKIDLSKY